MDPFAPDSDAEDERALQGAQGNGPASGHRHSTSGQQEMAGGQSEGEIPSMQDSFAGHDIGEDEGPPASIVLDTHDEQDHLTAGPSTPSVGAKLATKSARTPPASESVRLTRIGGKQTGNDVVQAAEDPYGAGDDLEHGEDEEDGLIALPNVSSSPGSRSSSSSRRHNRKGDVLSRMVRKIRKGAERIRAQDGMDRSMSASDHPARKLNARERALWRWGTLENMDEFLQEVYGYYVGKGLVCILLAKVLNLLTIAFVIGFSTFLVGCVDYSAIKHDGQLSDVVVHQCLSRFSGLTILAFALFIGMYGWQVIRFGLGISNLIAMRNFYTHLLNVPDADVQSISWHDIVSRISHLRENHPTLSLSSSQDGGPVSAGKLDAHDVANRIMRQENYLVALFNKDVLDLKLPLPGMQHRTPELTRSLEWNLTFCLLGFLFDNKGQVRRQFLTERHRKDLIEGLRRRFIFMAIINAIFAPFIVIYLLFYSFFRYFEEYHKNPSYLGARQYTQFARWKFREFNELPHIFRRRCHNSYPYAQRYIDQFPKERIAIIARFVSFVAGSFTAVLLLASVLDPDLFVHFDISPQRNVLFYIGVFGAILAVSRAMVPDEQQVFEPEVLLRAVIEYTHYLPEHWKHRFHSADVHAEFGTLYRLKISIFVSELLSVLFTPFVLWKSLPRSAPAIIDFFREFTVHVDDVGYVCSFAVFDFKRHGNMKFGAPHAVRDERLSSKEGKMEQSLLGFRAANPTWQPTDPTASLFLSRLAAEMATPSHFSTSPPPPPAPIGKMSGVGEVGAGGDRSYGAAKGVFTGSGPGTTRINGSSSGGVNFTPANSTLAQRSQLYNDAFERSILLASKPGNAAALQASAVKSGPRSTPVPGTVHGHRGGTGYTTSQRKLQAVDEDRSDSPFASGEPLMTASEEDDPLNPNDLSIYEDARPERVRSSAGANAMDNGQAQPVNLRGLLHHIGTSRW